MNTPNWKNRTLFHGDNLDILRGMNSESVDLIATDPPFNKGRDFHATPDSLTAGSKFQDRWSWDHDVHQAWVDQIIDDHPKLWGAIEAARFTHSDSMGAFLCFLAVRVLAMHRILKPTGSLWLHCDDTASHYIKLMLDAIFGVEHFRNEVVWQRTYPKNTQATKFHRVTDRLLHYAKNAKMSIFNPMRLDASNLKPRKGGKIRIDAKTGREYMWADITAPKGGTNSRFFEFMGVVPKRPWMWGKDELQKAWDDGLLEKNATGDRIYRKKFMDSRQGPFVNDLWTDIERLHQVSVERVGYPTQKPVALYERIIKASAPEGGIVLDPFAGCATTCVAAERL
ncbi:MAG: hypothetical protein ISN29_03555, partial [Gammaproteobacteria bacterium AqS3]|nr:hypothetical protein [Gammaproteobacteria bacterium AqS3]